MLQKQFALANYFFEVFSNSHITKQQLIKGETVKISPRLQRGIKAAEIATIETAKGLAGYAVTKDIRTAKLFGDCSETAARSLLSVIMIKLGHVELANKISYGNPLNIITQMGYVGANFIEKGIYKKFAKEMWQKPY